ncbi:MAG: methylenetetrahydrofolate reductase [Sedimentisphaerales bacterium]|nr:methylenetetrahydrofolate reductase [Sedimentisphaerales bacterium]
MKPTSRLATKIDGKDFIITAEYLPPAAVNGAAMDAAAGSFDDRIAAVNVADNPHGIGVSSLAASVMLSRAGVEPVYQIVTRDRNRIALQSDLLGAVCLGIQNVLCLSGYHQALTGCPESAHVYDIDSVQLVAAVNAMQHEQRLIDGTEIKGEISFLTGSVANPYLEPLELNILRLTKKVQAGSRFIQTQAVFDTERFDQWLSAADGEAIPAMTAILAGVLPLTSADEAERLRETYTDHHIPDEVIQRLRAAGDGASQAKEGLAIGAEIIRKLKNCKGLRGIHILSGGKESLVGDLLAAAGL